MDTNRDAALVWSYQSWKQQGLALLFRIDMIFRRERSSMAGHRLDSLNGYTYLRKSTTNNFAIFDCDSLWSAHQTQLWIIGKTTLACVTIKQNQLTFRLSHVRKFLVSLMFRVVFKVWQTSGRQGCWAACQISETFAFPNNLSCGVSHRQTWWNIITFHL